MRKDIIPASTEHEKSFRESYQLKPEFRDNPECIAAFEYAATIKLTASEANYIGAIIEKNSYAMRKRESRRR